MGGAPDGIDCGIVAGVGHDLDHPSNAAAGHLPPRAQAIIAAGVAAALVALAAWFVAAGGLIGRLVDHDAPPAATVAFTVNINTAGAAELAQLPGLGQATAERIVAHRREHGPFAGPDDLLAVPGIGPVTLEALRPHLRPIRPRSAP